MPNSKFSSLSTYLKKKIDENSINSQRPKPLLMTHIVAGYPSLETNVKQAKLMAAAGASLLEVQLPFSDPLADGPAIMAANQRSLENGTNIQTCLKLLKTLCDELPIPVIAMTYYNIPYRMGIEKFCEALTTCGVAAVIVPDIPFDESFENFYARAKKKKFDAILVLSQTIEEKRLTRALEIANAFLYVTLRVGVTGKKQAVDAKSLAFLNTLRKKTSLPLAAGFGISSPQQIHNIANHADIAVVGSHIIELLDNFGLSAVEKFLHDSLNLESRTL